MRIRHAVERAALGAVLLVMMRPDSAAAQTDSNHWNLSLSIREGRGFDRVTDGVSLEDRIVNGVAARLGYAIRSGRSSVGFSGRIGANKQRAPADDERLNYGASFRWNYRTSPRAQMDFQQTVSKNFRLQTLNDIGVLPSDLGTLSATSRWNFQHQPGPRTSWGTNVGYSYREFTTNVPVEGSQIVLDEQPFGDEVAIPDTVAPPDPATPPELFELPNGEDEILDLIATEGIFEPSLTSQRVSASFGVNHSFSGRTSVNGSIAGTFRTIESDDSRRGPTALARFGVSRSLSVTHSINTGYTFQQSYVAGPTTTVQTVYTGWSYSPRSARLSINVSGGASRFQNEGLAATTSPVANVSLSGAVTSSTSAGVFYRRQFTSPLGFGRSLLIDFFNASLSQEFGSRARGQIVAGASLGSDPNDDGSQIDTLRAGGSFTFDIFGGLSAGTSYFYLDTERHTSFSDFEGTRNNWSGHLTFSTGW